MEKIAIAVPLITFFVFIISFILHEIGHGYAAYLCGDMTPKEQGRLSFFTLKHFDITGSVIVPIILFLVGSGGIFGWGKPVPVNFKNMTRRQHVFVASSGILVNLVLAAMGFVLFSLTNHLMVQGASVIIQIACVMGFMFLPINIMLVFFNLIPLCPIDGWVIIKGLSKDHQKISDQKISATMILFNMVLAVFALSSAKVWILAVIKGLTYGNI